VAAWFRRSVGASCVQALGVSQFSWAGEYGPGQASGETALRVRLSSSLTRRPRFGRCAAKTSTSNR
jgi:hypothetical protein